MAEYWVHVLNWGPIEAESPEAAAREAHNDLSHEVNPVFTVTEEEVALRPMTKGIGLEFDSELWIDYEDGS